MDGFPGVITSDDDFGVNAAGIMITETTITQFEGWDPNGKPEFVRSRKALQYAQSIDDYVRIIKEGNNGGYANDWLIGDRKTGEIAYLELGLKNTPLWRTKDGYFVSSNFARDPKLIREETSGFDPNDISSSMNARHVRAEEMMQQAKGTIDVQMAEQFLADHVDSFEKKAAAERALALRPRRCLSARREGMGMGRLQSRRSGAGQSHRQQDGGEDEFRCARRTSLRRGFSGRRFSGTSSGIFVAKAAAARHESRSVDKIPSGPKSPVVITTHVETAASAVPPGRSPAESPTV